MMGEKTMLNMAQEIVKLNKAMAEKESQIAGLSEKIEILTHDTTEKDEKVKDLTSKIVGLEFEKEAEHSRSQNENNEIRAQMIEQQLKYESEVETLNKCLKSAQQRSMEQEDMLKKEIKELAAVVEVQQSQMISYAGQVNDLEKKSNDLEANNAELSKTALEDKRVISGLQLSLEDQVKVIKSELASEKGKSTKLEEFLKSTQLQLDESRSEVVKLARESEERLAQITSANEKASGLEATIKVIRRAKQDLKVELQKSHQKNVDLNAHMFGEQRKYTEEISNWKERDEKFEQVLKENEAELERAQNDKSELLARNEEVEGRLTSLEEYVSSLETKKIDLLMAISTQKSKLEDAQKKNSDLYDRFSEEKQKFVSEIRYWKEMNERLYGSVNNAQERLEETKKENEAATTLNEDLQIKITALTEQVFQLETMTSDNVFELEANNTSLERINKKLNEKLRTAVANAEQLSEKVAVLEKDKETLEITIEELSGHLEDGKTATTDIRNQLQDQKKLFSAEMTRWEERYTKLQQSYEETKENLGASWNSNERLTSKNLKMKEKLSFLSGRVAELDTGTRHLQRTTADLSDSLEEANRKYNDLSGHVEDRKEKYDRELAGWKETYEKAVTTIKELEGTLKVARRFNNMQTSRFLELELKRQAQALKGIENYNIGEEQLRLVLSEGDIFESLGEENPTKGFQEERLNDGSTVPSLEGTAEVEARDGPREGPEIEPVPSAPLTKSFLMARSHSDASTVLTRQQKSGSQVFSFESNHMASSGSVDSESQFTVSDDESSDDDEDEGDSFDDRSLGGRSSDASAADNWFWAWTMPSATQGSNLDVPHRISIDKGS